MKAERTYKAGRETTGWRKGERVTSLAQLRAGDILIKDSHQFKATNLVRVRAVLGSPSPGFDYQRVKPDGSIIVVPVMFARDYELKGSDATFYHAERS